MQRPIGLRINGHGLSAAHERVAADVVHLRQTAGRRKGQTQGDLSQAVHRFHRLQSKAMGSESLVKASDGLGTDGLRSVERVAPRTQVQPLKIGVRNTTDTELIGKVRSRRNSASILVDRPQPAGGSGQKRQGRHQYQAAGKVQTAEPGSDQTHVVVERQPTDEHVRRFYFHHLSHDPDVGQQVVVGQDHTLGVAGAAGSVLQKGDVVRPGWVPIQTAPTP